MPKINRLESEREERIKETKNGENVRRELRHRQAGNDAIGAPEVDGGNPASPLLT